MESKEETQLWTKFNSKEVEDIKGYYVALSNKQREELPPILDHWFRKVCNL